jgi:ABC-type uncharacterized transport system substrate-binding protein
VISRRQFIALVGGAGLAASRDVAAQAPAKVPRIAYLSLAPGPSARSDAFVQGLRELGHVEPQTMVIEYRWCDGAFDRARDAAADLVHARVDVIVTGGPQATRAARDATTTIPIVMAAAGDPVAFGLVQSLARPGGNITGLSQIAPELSGKRLELLKEIAPQLARVAVLWNPKGTTSPIAWKESQAPAHELGLALQSIGVQSPDGLDKAIEGAKKARAGALAILPDPLFAGNLRRIAELAAKNHLPSIFHLPEFVEAGGLLAYGPDRMDMFRRAATYVDKILKGAKPADLPVEQPTKFELVINLKTAKQIGLTIPPNVLARADRVIK